MLFLRIAISIIWIDFGKKNNEIKDFSKYEAYNEFTSYLAEKENNNLNIITGIEQIKSNLKLGFQHEKQEVFGCLLYDENYNIQKTLNLFKGGIASSIVDTRILFKEVLKNEKIINPTTRKIIAPRSEIYRKLNALIWQKKFKIF